MVQVMWYIILPQAFRKIIPTLMSQVITIIKDTSFLANVAPSTDGPGEQGPQRSGPVQRNRQDQCIRCICPVRVCGLVYFIINYSLSCVVRHVQANLEKVGESEPAPEVPANVEMAK